MAKTYYITSAKELSRFADVIKDISKALDKSLGVKIEVSRIKPDKTTAQLGYYWGVVLPTILEKLYDDGYSRAEYSIEKLHEVLKMMFFYEEIIPIGGDKIVRVSKSIAAASVDEMSNFLNDVIVWAGRDAGVEIPPAKF